LFTPEVGGQKKVKSVGVATFDIAIRVFQYIGVGEIHFVDFNCCLANL